MVSVLFAWLVITPEIAINMAKDKVTIFFIVLSHLALNNLVILGLENLPYYYKGKQG
ncbi:hypothetical protein [Moraxella lacunata]|uniref:hypothetical protein n=1 Tax=Moraxella lacunata TaxID=477 RepID=UPI003EDF71CC